MMSFIHKAHRKPRLHVSANLLYGAWPPCCATSKSLPRCAPASNTASHDNHEKINSWVFFTFYGCGAPLGTPLIILLLISMGISISIIQMGNKVHFTAAVRMCSSMAELLKSLLSDSLTLGFKCPEMLSSSSKSNLHFISNTHPSCFSNIPL